MKVKKKADKARELTTLHMILHCKAKSWDVRDRRKTRRSWRKEEGL